MEYNEENFYKLNNPLFMVDGDLKEGFAPGEIMGTARFAQLDAALGPLMMKICSPDFKRDLKQKRKELSVKEDRVIGGRQVMFEIYGAFRTTYRGMPLHQVSDME